MSTIAIVMIVGGLIGAGLAELWHRRMMKGYKIARLKAEYLDKQLWQFISLDEWLKDKSKL